MNYTLQETSDYRSLAKLYSDGGLEVPSIESPSGEVVKHWKCTDDTGKLIAGATLLYKGRFCVLEYLAVTEDMQGQGIGAKLLRVVEVEAKTRGIHTLWLCGKVPAFYQKFGWLIVDGESAPPISLCQNCPDFQITCTPEIMKKNL